MEQESSKPPRKRTCFRKDIDNPGSDTKETERSQQSQPKCLSENFTQLTQLLQSARRLSAGTNTSASSANVPRSPSEGQNLAALECPDWKTRTEQSEGKDEKVNKLPVGYTKKLDRLVAEPGHRSSQIDAGQPLVIHVPSGRLTVDSRVAGGQDAISLKERYDWEAFIHEIVDKAHGKSDQEAKEEDIPSPRHLLEMYVGSDKDPLTHFKDYTRSHGSSGSRPGPGPSFGTPASRSGTILVVPPEAHKLGLPEKSSGRQALIKHLAQSITAKNSPFLPEGKTVGTSSNLGAGARERKEGNVVYKPSTTSTAPPDADLNVTPEALDLSLPRVKDRQPPVASTVAFASPRDVSCTISHIPNSDQGRDSSGGVEKTDPIKPALHAEAASMGHASQLNRGQVEMGSSDLHRCQKENVASSQEWRIDLQCPVSSAQSATSHVLKCKEAYGVAPEKLMSCRPHVVLTVPQLAATAGSGEINVRHSSSVRPSHPEISTTKLPSVSGDSVVTSAVGAAQTSDESEVCDLKSSGDLLPESTKSDQTSGSHSVLVKHQTLGDINQLSLKGMTEYFVDVAIREGMVSNDV